MDMHLKENIIRSYRTDRAWSQAHLAEIAGLSLRTIQRIEKTHSASLESAKAIAAVFNIDVVELQAKSAHREGLMSFKSKLFGAIAAGSMGISAILAMKVAATPIMVDLMITSKGETLADVQFLNEEDNMNELKVSKHLKVALVSQKQADKVVKISTFIYDISSDNTRLISAPSVFVEHQKTAEIHVGNYKLFLKPYI